MKRSPIKIGLVVLVCIAVGAAVNVLIAWGIAIWQPVPDQSAKAVGKALPRSFPLVPADWPVLTEVSRASKGGHVVTQARFGHEGTAPLRIYHQQTGWPCTSMEMWTQSPTPGSNRRQPAIEMGYRVPQWIPRFAPLNTPYASRLGLLPDMPGFLVNTLLYAGVSYGLLLLMVRARMAMRLRRGVCPVCRYPIGIADRCTECGRELPRWVVNLRGDNARAADIRESATEG